MAKKKKKVKKPAVKKATGKGRLLRSEYAKLRGVSLSLICRYVKQGRVSLGEDLRLDPKVADKELNQKIEVTQKSKLKTDDKAPSGDTANDATSFNEAKAKRERFKANLAELEYKEKAGLLVEVAQVRKEGEDLYRRYRDQMLNVVIRATKKLLGETNEFKFRTVLKKEIESAIKRIE